MSTHHSHRPLSERDSPTWAKSWGQDSFGLYAGFRLGEVEHRFRWIPPGQFMMGSPDDEAGRQDWEGPRHAVRISQGFWLGEVPCTQELWQAVTGENPSRFKSPSRPVEEVSWEDCQSFLQGLNQRIAGLEARLPTEAEWEYACRAGTAASTYAGELEILGLCNGPVLDEIAWYTGNSGVDFDLDEGEDSSDWAEKQYAHEVAGLREVKGKRANPWGLFDMLGNVREWCEDCWDFGTSYPGSELRTDPIGQVGPHRVLRGGSWFTFARGVRAAVRGGGLPDNGIGSVGFRIAHSQG